MPEHTGNIQMIYIKAYCQYYSSLDTLGLVPQCFLSAVNAALAPKIDYSFTFVLLLLPLVNKENAYITFSLMA